MRSLLPSYIYEGGKSTRASFAIFILLWILTSSSPMQNHLHEEKMTEATLPYARLVPP